MAAPPIQEFYNPFFPGSFSSELHAPESAYFGATPDTSEHIPVAPRSTLSIAGQGTIAVSSDAMRLLSFSVMTDLDGGPTPHLLVGVSEFLLYVENESGKHDIPYIVTKTNRETKEDCMLNAGEKTTYWLSLDDNNGKLRYGKYYTSKAMTLIEADLKFENDGGLLVWKEPEKFSWLEQAKTVQNWQDDNEPLIPLINPLPVVIDRPPFVRPADQVPLTDLDRGLYTAPANLPEVYT